MFSADRRNYWIERGPDGRLQEARDILAEHRADRWAEKESSHDEVIIEVEHNEPERDAEVLHLRRNLPSFAQVERLLDLYVATGEGRGAYVKAKKQVEVERRMHFFGEGLHDLYGFDDHDDYDDFRRRQEYMMRPPNYDVPYERRRHPWQQSESGSDNDNYRSGGRVPLRPSGGGPHTGSGPAYIIQHGSPERGGPSAAPPRSPERPTAVRIAEMLPSEALHRSRSPGGRPGAVIHQEEVRVDRPGSPPERLPRPYLHVPRMAARYREARMYRHPTVQDVSDEDSDLDLASLPSEEDDLRLQPRSSRHGQRERSTQMVRVSPSRDNHTEMARRSRTARMDRRSRIGTMRAGGGPEYEFEQRFGRNLDRYTRLRGGGPILNPPTKTSGVAPEVLETYSVRSKAIFLYFFSINRGRIISSHQAELYRTFRELYNPRYSTDAVHRSDAWLVENLKKHYLIICRRSRRSFWDLISMRTIGFATFIRFERTVKRTDDPGNFFVTARAPAISAEGNEAVSHFIHMMRYPLQKSKMMLFLLDRLAGSTKRGSDHNSFYVVEIKETFDTSKIYTLLFLVIMISTAAGVTYAVVKSDPGTGLSIASYVVTCLSLIAAVLAAGEWLGLAKPDSFSFAYDWVENRVVSKEDFGSMTGGRRLR